MPSSESENVRRDRVPEELRSLFWDHDFDQLQWPEHCDFVAGRILEAGSWEAVRWLRSSIGDAGLRDWMERHQGRPLSKKQLRFWQLVLELPPDRVDRWLQLPARKIWEGRKRR